MNDFEELERVAGAMLARLEPGKRRSVLRKMAGELAKGQRRRIASQKTPDGDAFEARKEKQPPLPGRGPACFLYPSAGGERRVLLKSFVWESGRKMTGFDVEAGAIRTFSADKVAKWLPVPAGTGGGGGSKLRRRGSLRRKAMFRRLATGKFLRAGANDHELWVGFTGLASKIASVHQYGLRDRPSLRAQAVRYPKRELLGATEADRARLLDVLMDHISGD